VDQISRWDVGIMPLPDSPFARGKCAFKIIQYMGCWKPVVASPVGENTWVVEHGVNGFLASSMAEWKQALSQLYENRDAGARMGVAGRARVEQSYSRQTVAPRVAGCLIDAVVRRGGKNSTSRGLP
jgi:glycosyltransferase involved in cell wall biosynthesis